MARADLLVDLVRAGARGDQNLFRRVVEALMADERGKQHNVLADRLSAVLQSASTVSTPQMGTASATRFQPVDFFYTVDPLKKLSDLYLSVDVRAACQEVIEEQHRADLLRSYNLEPRHRILLAGPPGNGKTSLAEAIASELAVPLMVVRYEAVIASFLGETAVRLARLFEQVRGRRCVLFLDEFDVVGKERGDVHETGEIKRVVSSILLQIDALPTHVVVITATNHPELLDKAVWRRFQMRLAIDPPLPKQIERWMEDFEQRLGVSLGLSPATLAKHLRGLSYSEIEQFSLDVQRRFVLSLPNSDVHQIVRERIKQVQSRFTPRAVSKRVKSDDQ